MFEGTPQNIVGDPVISGHMFRIHPTLRSFKAHSHWMAILAQSEVDKFMEMGCDRYKRIFN